MSEPDFPEAVAPHETALVHIAADTHDTPFTRVLPHGDIPAVGQHGFFLRIHRNHQLIVIDLTQQMLVVEIAEGIEQRLLTIGALHHSQEPEKRFPRTGKANHRTHGLTVRLWSQYQSLESGPARPADIVS